MEKVDITIIGAGVVGLAIARFLAQTGREIVVLEQHDSFGRETSSRNSEVIHAGLYYPHGSLKAQLCVQGRHLLYELCTRHKVPCQKIGKLVVGSTQDEIAKIEHIAALGKQNGAEGLKLLTRRELNNLEPNVNAQMALLSPETGIVDSHALMKCYAQHAESNGVMIAYNCAVTGIGTANGRYIVSILDADGEAVELQSEIVINAAGLGADAIAGLVGLDIDSCGYRQHPCKGEYFSVANRCRGMISRLVYPAPTAISLGIHAVVRLDGSLKLGPNAFFVDSIDYDVDPSHSDQFFKGASVFMPFINENDLAPDMAGIRPKLQAEGKSFHDFIIREESAHGLAGFVNLLGIESPGLTSSAAIADYVAAIISSL